MARASKFRAFFPWSGGLNTSVDPMIMDPQDLIQCDNVIFTNSLSKKKRGGQSRYNSTPIPSASAAENVVFLTDYWATVSNAKREYFVAVTDSGHVYKNDFVTTTWISMSTLTLSVVQGGVTSTVIDENLVLGISGSGVPKVWYDQSSLANLVNLTASSGVLPFTNCSIVTSFLERLVVAGDTTRPDFVDFSSTGDLTNWTTNASAAGFAISIPVGVGDGDPSGITSVFTGTGADLSLYVAKRKHLYRIDCSDPNQNNWIVIPITNEIGVVNHNTVAKIDMTDVVFASDRGIHALSQVITSTAIIEGSFLSFPIQYDYKNVVATSDLAKMSAIYVPDLNSYLLGCRRAGQSTYETVYGFNVELKKWFRWTSVPCNFLLRRFNKSTGLDELYAAAPAGRVNKLQQTALNDFGSPISTTLKSAFISGADNPFIELQFVNLACLYRSRDNSTFTVQYSVDGITTQSVIFNQKIAGGNVLGTTLLGSGFILGQIQAIKPVWNHLATSEGNTIQLTFQQFGLNQDFELFGLLLEYEVDEEAQNAFTSALYSS